MAPTRRLPPSVCRAVRWPSWVCSAPLFPARWCGAAVAPRAAQPFQMVSQPRGKCAGTKICRKAPAGARAWRGRVAIGVWPPGAALGGGRPPAERLQAAAGGWAAAVQAVPPSHLTTARDVGDPPKPWIWVWKWQGASRPSRAERHATPRAQQSREDRRLSPAFSPSRTHLPAPLTARPRALLKKNPKKWPSSVAAVGCRRVGSSHDILVDRGLRTEQRAA